MKLACHYLSLVMFVLACQSRSQKGVSVADGDNKESYGSAAPGQSGVGNLRENSKEQAGSLYPFLQCTDCLTSKLAYRFSNSSRTFNLYIPKSAPSKLVMVLHGNGGSADQITGGGFVPSPLRVWLELARRDNFLLVVPEGMPGTNGKLGWNDCRADAVENPVADDVGFLSALANDLTNKFGVTKRFVTGMSNGGHMSIRLALEAPEVFAGAGVVSAAVAKNSQCVAKNKPISLLLMRGTADPISPFLGGAMAGSRGMVLSMDDTLKVFLDLNKIVGDKSTIAIPDIDSNDKSTVAAYQFPDGISGTKVEGWVVNGGGHVEPSKSQVYGALYKSIVGEQNRDIECAEVVWKFFSKL